MSIESYSLFELNEYIKRVIALNFSEPIWIHAEIAQINEARGQYYIELIEKEEGSEAIKAQLSAVIWYKSILFLKKKLGDLLDQILRESVVIKAKVNVEFHERFGLKLIIQDIDPSYTLGLLEMERRKIIDRLEKEGLLEANEELDLPAVIQNIAIISSQRAAGYQDFVQQLQNNPYGYTFNYELFDSAVQGRNLENEIVKALLKISASKVSFDVILIIRGGGSKLDLGGFDSYRIGKEIAKQSIPVITGIGHDIDETITDLVAHTALKTPTAVAEWVVSHNLEYEQLLLNYMQQIIQYSSDLVQQNNLTLKHIEQLLEILPLHRLQKEQNELDRLIAELKNSLFNEINNFHYSFKSMKQVLALSRPSETLKRGYALVKKEGNVIVSAKRLKKEDLILIHFSDGKKSAVTQ